MKTFTFFADPAHAWLKVCPADLIELGLTMNDFSAFSYIGANAFYLEEDCDATKFIALHKAKHGEISFAENHTNGQSHIRRMIRNQPLKAV